ncbi:MAG TPA: DNA-directed RNA polymerase subunit omega [Armatimonadota bacterium]|nr:DNA-directed RNA polymerase subunit omega [Armatimonadota bacterium]HOM80534.1 DNA-directed RNA polymerase subunit omega [Armatimonadota bacterium]HPO71421.1 DNA-directed RNA polymerase subunit omega [Armatimonadota bacterium]HPT96895.1 DNA-directed RNA polymerase subunit omega [Armatimonadota bacterium]
MSIRPSFRAETEGKRRNTYELVVLAAKRARQLREGAMCLVDPQPANPLTAALAEIAEGKIDSEYVQEISEG